ncbi:MAG: OsmC family protein [Thermoanaerobaculia bacterium]
MATVTAELRQGTQVTIRARRFAWRGDEPRAVGGTDTGPTPYEMLLGSLAACITVTLRLYADHKGIDLAGVDVTLEFDRVHADDCLDCDRRKDGWIDRIRTRVTIRGAFDDAQRKRLAQVAARCPVHKTLANGVEIFDSVTFEEADSDTSVRRRRVQPGEPPIGTGGPAATG